MYCNPIRVPPEPKYVAEVVVLLTTLGAKRTEFNSGKRARDLLEIKRVHHKVIDFNRDARQAGSGEVENKAITKLMENRKLQQGDNQDLVLPQIFVDGQYLGDANDLQGLEDDGLLDEILLRRRCLRCNDKRRTPESAQCPSCWEVFEEILPGVMTIEEHLQEIAEANGDHDYDDDEDYAEAEVAVPPAVLAQAASQAPASASTSARAPRETEVVEAATVGPEASAEPGVFAVGEQVQYWSDTKMRWLDALVDGVREKDGRTLYDLNCKKGAVPEKLRRPP